MNTLLINWSSNSELDLYEALTESGIHTDTVAWSGGDYEDNPNFEKVLEQKIKGKTYDFFISFDFFPIVSKVCERWKIKYAAWVYDSPHLTLYSKTIFNACNYLFVFDSELCRELQGYGVKKVYYLPMAVNEKRMHLLFESCERENLQILETTVSFVGGLYKNEMYDEIQYLPQRLKGYLEGVMQAQKVIYGYNFLEEMLDEPHMQEVRQYVQCTLDERFFAEDKKIFAEAFLGKKVTNLERMELLSYLEQHQVPVGLYSGDVSDNIGSIISRGSVDYRTKMPIVFRQSKINLNISLKSIHSGVPLRVYDILGAGGFCITNFQADLLKDNLIPGEDLVVYENKEDLYRKVEYYLQHEEERKKIADSGYHKILELHTYSHRMKEILERLNN